MGLILSHLLHSKGIESVVFESRSREELQPTVRTGVLEQGTTDLLKERGVGEQMEREGAVHCGIELRLGGCGRRIDLHELTDRRSITVYGLCTGYAPRRHKER